MAGCVGNGKARASTYARAGAHILAVDSDLEAVTATASEQRSSEYEHATARAEHERQEQSVITWWRYFMNRMKNKVAVITGGAGGIGAATASLLRSQGAEVIICDLPASNGEKIAGDLRSTFHPLDVSQEDQWARCVHAIEKEFGRIDVLVNGAGIEGDLNDGSPDGMSLTQWRKVMSVNLDGTFLGCREILPVMRRLKQGSIVNISSIASYYPTVQNAAYGASKAGVTQLTKSVAAQGALDGNQIRCNSIHPGLIETQMLDRIFATLRKRGEQEARARATEFKSRIPLGGSGRPEDVANLALFLASDESRYITGAELLVDGGWRLLR